MRVAYIKSGDIVEAFEHLSSSSSAQLDDGGPLGFLSDLLRAMPLDRFLVVGVATAASRIQVADPRPQVRAVTLPAMHRLSRLRNAVTLPGRILRFRPDAVLCGKCGYSLWGSYLAARIAGVPFLHSRHNWHEDTGVFGRLARALDNWIVRRADAVVCHGPYLRDRLGEIGVAVDKTFEFDSGNRALVASAESAMRESDCAGSDDSNTVLYVGRMVQPKGIFDLLEAAARLVPEVASLRLIFAGAGPDLESLREAIQGRGLMDRVDVLGRLAHDDVGRLMKRCRLVVTPTRSSFPEGRCMVAMEALALGVPVIAPKCGPFPYLVQHGVNGLLYRPNSVDDLTRFLGAALKDDKLYRSIKAGAVQSGAALLHPTVSFSQAVSKALTVARQGAGCGIGVNS